MYDPSVTVTISMSPSFLHPLNILYDRCVLNQKHHDNGQLFSFFFLMKQLYFEVLINLIFFSLNLIISEIIYYKIFFSA